METYKLIIKLMGIIGFYTKKNTNGNLGLASLAICEIVTWHHSIKIIQSITEACNAYK